VISNNMVGHSFQFVNMVVIVLERNGERIIWLHRKYMSITTILDISMNP